MNTIDIIVEQYTNEEKMNALHIERERVMQDKGFQQWLKDMRIGSRCEVKNQQAIDMNKQYDYSIRERGMPEFIQRWF